MLEDMAKSLDSNPDVKKEIDGLANELFSKDVMLESMEELRDKLATYLETKGSTLPEADLTRYRN